MELHSYQKNALDALVRFFGKTQEDGVAGAFVSVAQRPYLTVEGLGEQTPIVCLRVPTGGGKTLMAAHALVVAAQKYAYTDEPVCLWLAPSNTIVEQTLRALRTHGHPYRQALDNAFAEVNIYSATDALSINRAELDGAASVIVATVQSLRRQQTEGRKIYDDNGRLMEHFEGLSNEMRAQLEQGDDGIVNQSLANALFLRNPIVIMDEAHNARTPLSFASLARFNPSCIIEFTATPKLKQSNKKDKNTPSNVLCHVSARELQQVGMIKMPIKLRTHIDWREAMENAIEKRKELENIATGGIRPIVLYQAENVNGEANVSQVKKALLGSGIPEEEIRIATGTERGLDNVDLFATDCLVRHIITVQALAEGWDCSFAYVLCALSNIAAPRAVEQILGRVLRMPFARINEQEALNCAYAFARSENFDITAQQLSDSLVQNAGFQKLEAKDFIANGEQISGTLFDPPGQSAPPSNCGVKKGVCAIKVPMLGIRYGKQLELVEQECFLEQKWDLAKLNAEVNFMPPKDRIGKGEIAVNTHGKVVLNREHGEAEPHMQQSIIGVDWKWTKEDLAVCLDKNIRHDDITSAQSSSFILQAINGLIAGGTELKLLVRHRLRLQESIARKIAEHRQAARSSGVQLLLKGASVDGGKITVSEDLSIIMNEKNYAPNWFYEGSASIFRKHLFNRVGELKSRGEEFLCACHLEGMEEVDFWIRNLERKEHTSFWLPTSGDKFYPDFVAQLKDGRILVVEYKGAHLWENAKEDRDLGNIWAKLSGGKCLFVMLKNQEWQTIDRCVMASK